MKKKLVLIAILLVAIVTAFSVSIKPTKSTDQFLYEAGFKVIPELTGSSFESFWKENYDLKFFSTDDMKKLCDANAFIIGPADRYLEAIPPVIADNIKNNYNKIKDEFLSYCFYNYEDNRWGEPVTGEMFAQFSGNEVKWLTRNRGIIRGQKEHSFWFNKNKTISRFVKKSALMHHGIPDRKDWVMVRNLDFQKIYIVAAINKFNTQGMIIEDAILKAIPKPDPMAMIKHRGGWVVLAHWQ